MNFSYAYDLQTIPSLTLGDATDQASFVNSFTITPSAFLIVAYFEGLAGHICRGIWYMGIPTQSVY